MALDKAEFRSVMGCFATGVTVVTTRSASGELHGLTANAFSSVSLEPPLVLVCISKKSESYPCFEQSGVFTVNILEAAQEHLSRRFAESGGNKFEGVEYQVGANGAPILGGVLAYLECKVAAVYEGGDHTIYVGEVQQVEARSGAPLLFYRGGYRDLGE